MANLFRPRPQPAPAITPSPAMPDPETSGLEARRKAQRDALARAGRASTILTARRPAKPTAAPSYDTFAAAKLG